MKPARGASSVSDRAAVLALALACALAMPLAGAHGENDPADALVQDGKRLVVGTFDAAQAGPLVIVPHVEEPPACAALPERVATLALGDDATASLYVTDDALVAVADLPPTTGGYAAFAVDTHDASRALLLMTESVVAIHALSAVAWSPNDGAEARTGVLGIPYAAADAPEMGHDMADPEGGGILLDHDNGFGGGRLCAGDVVGHRAFRMSASSLPESVTPGRVVHVVLLYDPEVPTFLPRPIDGSTRVVQANLYLARPGEDPEALGEAFSGRVGAADVAPLLLGALGLVGLLRARAP